ncbi:hypothetical protein ACHQM5_027532 [Ranunculus cassubicifolius]
MEELCLKWPKKTKREIGGFVMAILPYAYAWTLWNVRNEAIFEEKELNVQKIITRVMAIVWTWLSINKEGAALKKHFRFDDIILRWVDWTS